MAKLLVWIQTVLVPWLGAPGVFVVAFLDSSFLSLPEITDVLVVTSGMRDAPTAWAAALMATLGSVAGCTVLWWLGRKGGEGLLSRRFGRARVERTRDAFARWDLLALAGPAVMPPPMPFKAFVIAAGVFRVPFWRFAATIFLARGLRYAVWVVVSLTYHERALRILESADRWFADRAAVILLAAAAVVLLAAWWVVRRRSGEAPSTADGPAA
jgi:membrane protein YqaA with SNARE-associated domain